jgi:pimeloyl-ACP methyl ester carboxylesterase
VNLTPRTVVAPAGRIHVVEAGSGPLVLLVHGFPEGWYSWRHQLSALADAGYRAAAIDVRGYGRSSKPADPEAYGLVDLAADNAAVVRELGATEAVVVGHDWGSPIAATSALLHPDVFRAVGLLSVPYTPPGGPRPSEAFAAMGSDPQFYVAYFQQPGVVEREIEPDVRGWLRGAYTALTGDAEATATRPWFMVPAGRTMRDGFPDRPLPAWLDEADLDYWAAEFERTGFVGALNRYRCMDKDWADLGHLAGAVLDQPALFAIGEYDASRTWLAAAIDKQSRTLPGLISNEVIAGAGHWIQQEAAERTTELLLDWLRRL